MPELLYLQGKSRSIKIARDIGTDWYEVGTALLNDTTGAIMPEIKETFQGNIRNINTEILR